MPSVTADSNIWVSAFGYGGKPRRLIEMADAGEIRVDISEFIIDEVLRTLRDKFEWSAERLQEARGSDEGDHMEGRSLPDSGRSQERSHGQPYSRMRSQALAARLPSQARVAVLAKASLSFKRSSANLLDLHVT